MKKIYTAIDIGSDTIKFIIGEIINNKLVVLSSHIEKSKGIRKGLIIDSNLAINSIKDGIKELKNKIGINIDKVIVNVPSYNAKFMLVTAEKDITKEDNVITTDDINSVIKSSVYSKLAKEYELITVIPIEYMIDDKKVEFPIGKTANKLSMKGIMISVPKKNVYSVLSVIEGAGLEVVDITLSPLADYAEVKTDNLDKKIGAVINIGHETTNVSVYNKGKLMNTEIIQLGGINIDKDLSYMFNVNVFDARVLKEKFSSSHKRFIALNDVYEIKNTAGEIVKLNQLEVSEVVMERLSEILTLAKRQILLLTKQNISYILITGGLTEIKAFKNLVYEVIGKNVVIFNEDTIGARDNKYITCIGMIKYFHDKNISRGREYTMIDKNSEDMLINPNSRIKKGGTKVAKIFENFIGTREDLK